MDFKRQIFVTLAVGSQVCFHASAQDPTSSLRETDLVVSVEKISQSERPSINFQVLRQWQVGAGGRTIILNRVTPPVLPPAPPVPVPPTAEEMAAADDFEARHPAKNHAVLFLSATVYDRKVTEIRWLGAQGECRIFSNIDFNLLSGMGGFETDETAYSLMLALDDQTAAEAAAKRAAKVFGKQIPQPEEFSATQAEYIVAEDAARKPPTAEDLTALNALHVYFDANKQRLAESYLLREKANVERQRELKEHPPAPRDTVIHYWKNTPAPGPARTGDQTR